ncbi:peptidase M15 (plasmid) [Bradyrhizobium sp. PMVTL-01]|uniref:peptidase M15 n=1 Tax=Bradyrhizobium sp. PMVTL-01 TaxID=3434999 RepID=UPI003F70582C
MRSSRRRKVAALCRRVVLPSWIVACLAAFGSTGIGNSGAPAVERTAPIVVAGAVPGALPATVIGNAPAAFADVATTARSETVVATDTTTTSPKVEAMTDPAEVLPPQAQPVEVSTASTPEPEPRGASKGEIKPTVGSIEILDECWTVDVCVDCFLWALYQRTLKEDTIKVPEQRKVTVKRKGRIVTVTRTFTRLVDEDFAWKDPKAAERARMSMQDYVIGGMDRRFKLKLFHALHAAEQAGLSPGITSAFRDDFRQSIASGLKAASTRSFHGGSLRGGYGHGLAADVVSVTGGTRDERWTSSEKLWKWLDAHGKEFGVGRPYLNRDPPHLAPTDGYEYAAHNRGAKTRLAGRDVKERDRLAGRDNRTGAKPPKTAKSAKVRTI